MERNPANLRTDVLLTNEESKQEPLQAPTANEWSDAAREAAAEARQAGAAGDKETADEHRSAMRYHSNMSDWHADTRRSFIRPGKD